MGWQPPNSISLAAVNSSERERSAFGDRGALVNEVVFAEYSSWGIRLLVALTDSFPPSVGLYFDSF